MLWSVFSRLVVAMDDSAMVDFICSFSASRLNGLDFFLLSFFFLSLDELPKNDPEPEVEAGFT